MLFEQMSLKTRALNWRHVCVRGSLISIDNGLLFYRTDTGTQRIIAPHTEELKYRIFYEVHYTAISGRLGIEKTYSSQNYWWLKLYKWVRTYVRTCETYQRVKPSAYAAAPLASLPVPSGFWKFISMDFVSGLPKHSVDNTGILWSLSTI